MKIVTIIGARPQFIKAAVVSRVIQQTENLKEIIIHTGQHFDENMSDIFFWEMDIPKPDHNLNVHGLTHGAMTGRMMARIEPILMEEKPDWVLVYGDTNSTLAGAVTAKKLNINLAHVEAGLRSFNRTMPEEINRIVTDRISDLLFCPTTAAVDNLKKEGFDLQSGIIDLCGDVMFDAAMFYSSKARKPNGFIPDKFILSTFHRAENTDDTNKLKSIYNAINDISTEIPVVLPLHPRTKNKLSEIGVDIAKSSIIIMPPVGYLEMVWLLKNCSLVMTDSGGLQKEAFFFKKNCVIMREETEWVELTENNINFLAGSDIKRIKSAVERIIIGNTGNFDLSFYGDANAGSKIVGKLIASI
jgi:UDP-GlcNAc3NAcA epimerase